MQKFCKSATDPRSRLYLHTNTHVYKQAVGALESSIIRRLFLCNVSKRIGTNLNLRSVFYFTQQIKKINLATKECLTIDVTNVPPLEDAGGTLNEPGGICVHPSKPHLYIADTNNHAVTILDLQTRQLSLVCVGAKSTRKHSNGMSPSRIPYPPIPLPPGYLTPHPQKRPGTSDTIPPIRWTEEHL